MIYCNNCGKQGHVYNQCKMPITSIGFIVFRKRAGTNKYEYLLIRRKDSLGYVDFVRGNYTFHQKQHLLNLLEEMTTQEKEYLLDPSITFQDIWRKMWGNSNYYHNRHEEMASKRKFDLLRGKGATIQNEVVTLQSLFNELDTSWNEPEWGFPKGRRNYQERDIMCGFREFEEETGLSRNDLNIMSNLIPYEEIYTGSNYKTYKHRYFLAYYTKENQDVMTFQKTEVSKMEWKTLDEALLCIRPYNEERRRLLRNIEKMITTYPLVG